MSWNTWDEKQREYHKNNERQRKSCVKRAKCCFICKVPKTETRNKEDGKPYIFLSAAHLDHDPWNPKARMEALCQDCHNKWDADERSLNGKITNNQGKQEAHVELIGLKIKGDQDKLRAKNRKIRRNTFVTNEWRMRNLKRRISETEDTQEITEQLQLFDEHDYLVIQVDFPITQFLQEKEKVLL